MWEAGKTLQQTLLPLWDRLAGDCKEGNVYLPFSFQGFSRQEQLLLGVLDQHYGKDN